MTITAIKRLWMILVLLVCLTSSALAANNTPVVSVDAEHPDGRTEEKSPDHTTMQKPNAPPQLKPQPKTDGDDMARYRRLGWEWFGIKTGAPLLAGVFGSAGRYSMLTFDFLFFTYRWERAYLTIGEAHLAFFLGDAGLSVRAGYRQPLGGNLDYELRMGSSLGFRTHLFIENATIVPAPHVEVIANFNHASFGLGMELPVYFRLPDADTGPFVGDGESDDPLIQISWVLYVRVTMF